MISFDSVFLGLYRHLLRLLPLHLRVRYADEMVQLVRDRVAEPNPTQSRVARVRRAWMELADLLALAFMERVRHDRETAPDADSPYAESPRTDPPRFDPPRFDPPRFDPPHEASRRSWQGIPLRPVARRLGRRPAFAIIVVLILGLGVGAATSIFAVVDALLITPLPYADASRLVMVWRTVPSAGLTRSTVSFPDFRDWQAGARSFASLAAAAFTSGVLTGDGDAERVDGSRVSGNLFPTLGRGAALGRTLHGSDDALSAERTIVLSDALWRRRFGADRNIVDRRITIGDRQYRVVGVMPPDFTFPSARSQYWIPLQIDAARAERDQNFLTLIGRLEQGVTVAAAQAEIAMIARRVAQANPGVNEGTGSWVENRQAFVVRDVRQVLLILCGAVALLLAIACANVANLHLVRGTTRWRELSVRQALGATRWRLSAEQLAESVLIGAGAAVVATMLAVFIVRGILAFGPALPRATEIGMGWREFAFGSMVAVVCSILTGVLPYLGHINRIDTHVGGVRSTTGRTTHRLQHTLVGAQVALSLTLVVAAALLGQSFSRLASVPRGFEGERVLTAKVSLPSSRYASHKAVLQFHDQATVQLEAIPGVEIASGTWALPFSEDYASSSIVPADRPAPDKPHAVATLPVRNGFFRTLGVPLRHGRDFTPDDRDGGPLVAMVNETLARSWWGTTDVVGKRIRSAKDEDDARPITIVGVVADMKRRGLDKPSEPEVYWPHSQASWAGGDLYIAMRVVGEPAAYVSSLRRVIAGLDPQLPLTNVGSLAEFVNVTIVAPRFRTLLIGVFALLAGMLALVGVYATVSFVVLQQRQGAAVRSALGATPGRLFAEVLRSGMIVAAIGMAAGLAGALAAAPVMRTMLYDIAPMDTRTFTVASTALFAMVVIACWIPARRAAKTDPMTVLRESAA